MSNMFEKAVKGKESLEDFMKRLDKETLFNRKYMTKKY